MGAVAAALVVGVTSTVFVFAGSAAPAASVYPPPNSSSGYQSETVPTPTDGTFTAQWTVPATPVKCLSSGDQYATAEAYLDGGGVPGTDMGEAWSFTAFSPFECEDGAAQTVPSVIELDMTGVRVGLGGVATNPGNKLKVEVTVGSGSRAEIRGTLTDVTTAQQATAVYYKFKGTESIGSVFVGIDPQELRGEIPDFGRVNFYGLRLDGSPLASVAGLTQVTMLSKGGEPMVKAYSLSSSGTGFTAEFLRYGKLAQGD